MVPNGMDGDTQANQSHKLISAHTCKRTVTSWVRHVTTEVLQTLPLGIHQPTTVTTTLTGETMLMSFQCPYSALGAEKQSVSEHWEVRPQRNGPIEL